MERISAPRAALTVFCATLLAYGYFVYRGPHHNPDSRLALTYSLVERGALDVDPYAGTTLDLALARGHYYSDKAPGVSFLLAPLYAAVRLFPIAPPATAPAAGQRTWPANRAAAPSSAAPARGDPAGEDRFVGRYVLTFFGIGVPAAAFAAALFTWLGRLEPRVGPRLAVALGYALGSPAYPFAVSAFGHVPAAICLFTAFALLWRGPGRGTCAPPPALRPGRLGAAAGGALLGLAVAIEYPAALAALAVAAYGIWRALARRPATIALALGALPPLAGLAAYHWLAFGAPWDVGYAHLAPGTEYATGQAAGFLGAGWPRADVAAALVGGSRRGLLTYAPWLALALPGGWLLWRRRAWRAEAACALAVFGGLLALNSAYVFWDGGASWGPRHLVPALPFLALLALPAAGRWPRTAWALVAASVVMTTAAVATRSLPDPSLRAPLVDALGPAVLGGQVTNNWGQLLGLQAWRGVVPLAVALALLGGWLAGFGRSLGFLATAGWALAAVAALDRRYLEYSEGYYLYLGSRLAAGAALYADTASTQPPGLALVAGLLWRLAPDVYLPRLAAIGCYVAAALLAGRLARALSSATAAATVATLLAAALPLGAGAPHAFDANAILAPLAAALALLWYRGGRADGRSAAAAGAAAAVGLSVKLTFLPFALAPIAAALGAAVVGRGARWWRGRLGWPIAYMAGLGVAGGLHLALWRAVSGPAALDGLLGELESPLVPAGAALAAVQLAHLEGLPWALAAAGWWLTLRRVLAGAPGRAARLGPGDGRVGLLSFGLAAAALPLSAVHEGTFVGAARPAEPFVAAFAAVALVAGARAVARSGARRLRVAAVAGARRRVERVALALGTVAAAAIPAGHAAAALTAPPGADAAAVLARIEASPAAGGAVLAPPYYAALAGRAMLFDYADWTVWGRRSAAGAARERQLTRQAVALLEAGALPLVAADFRLACVPELQRALGRYYVPAGSDGDVLARRVTFFVPREGSAAGSVQIASASEGQINLPADGQR